MIRIFSQRRLPLVLGASAVGIAASWLTMAPFGLLAPVAALFLYAHGRAVPLLYATLIIALAGSGLAAYVNPADPGVLLMSAAFCAVALCIGAIVTSSRSLSADMDVGMADARLPDMGNTPPPDSVHPDDKPAAAYAAARAFWTGVPQIMRYRVRQPDGSYRWTDTRSDPEHGPSVDIDALVATKEEPMTTASQSRNGNGAVRSAEIIERLFGNAWAFDAAGRWIYLPQLAQTTLGVTPDDLNASLDDGHIAWKRLLHPDEYEQVAAAWRHCLRTGETFRAEFRIRRKTGVYAWARSAATPERDSEGRITGWYGTSIDIDVFKKTEEAFRSREYELSQIVDLVPVHIRRLTPEGEPIFFNKRLIDFLGLDLEDLGRPGAGRMPKVVKALVHPDDAAGLIEAVRHSIATGEPYSMKYRLRRADGVYRWVDGRAEPLRDTSGAIVQWYAISIDIDEEMRAQQALHERERSLFQLVETLPIMIDCAGPDGEPIYRSRQLSEFLGYGLESLEATGKSRLSGTLDSGVHPDDVEGVKKHYAHSLATGEPYARKHRLRRFDGEYRWVDTRAAPMRNTDGAIVQWNVTCLDIDREVKAQEELRIAQENLARASQAASMAELSASIAHEVNQPLAAIVANSHACHRWLSTEPANLERAKVTAERIIRDANSAADVISRIRALFRHAPQAKLPEGINNLVGEVCRLMADQLAAKDVRIETSLAPNLPSIMLDSVQMQQVIVNLIRNGIDAMDTVFDCARTLQITSGREGSDAIRVEVRDAGTGFMDSDRAFDPFFTTKQHGMGMGLVICRSIIESHGGRLWVANNETGGATVGFTLPVAATGGT